MLYVFRGMFGLKTVCCMFSGGCLVCGLMKICTTEGQTSVRHSTMTFLRPVKTLWWRHLKPGHLLTSPVNLGFRIYQTHILRIVIIWTVEAWTFVDNFYICIYMHCYLLECVDVSLITLVWCKFVNMVLKISNWGEVNIVFTTCSYMYKL